MVVCAACTVNTSSAITQFSLQMSFSQFQTMSLTNTVDRFLSYSMYVMGKVLHEMQIIYRFSCALITFREYIRASLWLSIRPYLRSSLQLAIRFW
jgi:hypothetical protein